MREVAGKGETIGERIRRLRVEQGKRQADLAGPRVSVQYVSKVELGRRHPSVRALRAIAGALGVSADYLETGREVPAALERELQLAEAELALRLDGAADRSAAILRRVLAGAVEDGDDATRRALGSGSGSSRPRPATTRRRSPSCSPP